MELTTSDKLSPAQFLFGLLLVLLLEVSLCSELEVYI